MLKSTKELEFIWAKPGREWTGPEMLHVQMWLNSEPQLQALYAFCLKHLGKRAVRQDAEDAWGEFNARKLITLMTKFDPAKAPGGFEGYLWFCLKQLCWRMSDKINREWEHRAGPPPPDEEGDDYELVSKVANDPSVEGPDLAAERKDQIQHYRKLVQDCLNTLRPKLREIVVLNVFEDYSYEEIAERLGIRVRYVNVLMCLARQKLKSCLREKGLL